VKFLSNFSQYNGLAMYYKFLEPRTEDIQKAFSIISSSIGVYEKQLMTVYNCKPEWPVCLYDFSFKNRVPNFFVLKVAKSLNDYVDWNYFAPGHRKEILRHDVYFRTDSTGKRTVNDDELLIERHYHLCASNEHFVPNFKKRYEIMDPLLLDNKNMIFAIDNELDINDKIQCFIKDVSQKISSGTEESLRKASESFKHAR